VVSVASGFASIKPIFLPIPIERTSQLQMKNRAGVDHRFGRPARFSVILAK
jgi:hypothetical protein